MIEQGSPEWRAMRCGKVTASRIADVMAKGRSGAPSLSRASYMGQLVAERLTGNPHEGYKSGCMEWGNEVEAEARSAYAFYRMTKIELVAFVDHPTIPMCGASPDGLVSEIGCVQFKCPNTHTHIDTLRGAPIDGGYLKQMQWEMACSGRAWCDFVSFDPRMPEAMALHIRRIPRDSAVIVEITAAVKAFQAELAETVADLLSQFPTVKAA